MLEVTSENVKELLASDKPLVLDFWAEWCAPCRAISPFTNKSSMVTCSIQFMLQRCYFFTKVPIFTLKILSYPVSFI